MHSPWVLIQARMSSSRLPGKTLMPFGETTLLKHQIDILERVVNPENIIILTSSEESDDPLVEYCQQNQICCLRGSLENVAERFYQAIQQYNISYFARFCADRPLYDSNILRSAFKLYNENDFDIITNMHPNTFPKGQTTEIISAKKYLECYPQFSLSSHFEHVTQYFYQNSESNIYNFTTENKQYSHLNMCVDTEEDYKKCLKTYKELRKSGMEESWINYVKVMENLTCVE